MSFRYSNRLGLHPLQVLALCWDNYDHDSAGDVSATSLGKSAKQSELLRRHADDIVIDVSQQAWSLFGKVVHGQGIWEPYAKIPGVILETKQTLTVPSSMVFTDPVEQQAWESYCSMPIHGPEQNASRPDKITITARPDMLVPRLSCNCPPPPEVFTFEEYHDWYCSNIDLARGYSIPDHKVTGTYAVIRTAVEGPRSEWATQLNVGACLAIAIHDIPVTNGLILAICRDWDAHRIGEAGYPPCPFAAIPVEIQDPAAQYDQVLAAIRLRLLAKPETDETALPECGPAYQWQKPAFYAVYHATAGRIVNGGKHPTMAEAVAQWKEYEASCEKWKPPPPILIPSQPRRCALYCNALPFCEEGQAAMEAVTNHEKWLEQYKQECERRRNDDGGATDHDDDDADRDFLERMEQHAESDSKE